MIRLVLPFPPSVNTYWRSVPGRGVLISKKGRQYREEVKGAVSLQYDRSPMLEGRLSVDISVNPPDRRRRDLDNMLKASLDAMQYAGMYLDDEQIDDLRISRSNIISGGVLTVTMQEI